MTGREIYSVRVGLNKNKVGFKFERIRDLFDELFKELREDGYFSEYLGSWCVDQGDMPGKVRKPEIDIEIKTRKDDLWPIDEKIHKYKEDDLFDVIEYLYTVVSKPLDGTYHSFANCGTHWHTFDKRSGEIYYCKRVNELFKLYVNSFEITTTGEILVGTEQGFESMFEAEVPTKDGNIRNRVDVAILRYRRHGSSLDDRRQAVRDLADVLEYIRPDIKEHLNNKDESDLFNIINNFGIRHHNDRQKTGYDASLWLSWMFYFFLATIHLLTRKIESKEKM